MLLPKVFSKFVFFLQQSKVAQFRTKNSYPSNQETTKIVHYLKDINKFLKLNLKQKIYRSLQNKM